MTGLIPLLIALPFLVGLALLLIRCDCVRRPVVVAGVIAVTAGSVLLAVLPDLPPGIFQLAPVSPEHVSRGMLVVEVAISLYLIWVGIRSRQWLISCCNCIRRSALPSLTFWRLR